MSAAVLVSLLLLGSPVKSAQDSVSAQRVEKLESRIDELEKQVLEYRARENYFQSILASQRWTFGMVVGLFAALVGVVGFGVFKRYVSRVEETQKEMEDYVTRELEDMRQYVDSLEAKVYDIYDDVKDIESEFIMKEAESHRDEGKLVHSILYGLEYSNKIHSKNILSNNDKNKAAANLSKVESDVKNLKEEKGTISGMFYDSIKNTIKELDKKIESGDKRTLYRIREELRDVEIIRPGGKPPEEE